MTKTTPLAISLRKSALRRAKDLTVAQVKSMETILGSVAADPAYRHNNIKALAGSKDVYRLRLGDWRVIFTIDRNNGTLTVTKIRPRGSAYK